MTRDEAIKKATQILNIETLEKGDIDAFYDLEPFLPDDIFGDLMEALIVITPPELLDYV